MTIESSDAIRGTPVSGRVWKSVQTKRSSSMGAHKKGWERQMQERRQREILMAMKREKEEEKTQEAAVRKCFDRIQGNFEWISSRRNDQAAKKAKEERLKRKAENEKKAEVVQKISAAKLKRMKKKQLRQIRKQ